MATQIQIKGIMSFPHLFEPRSVKPGDAPKFSVNCLIRKNDPQVQQVMAAIDTEKQNTFPSGFPANGKICLKDNQDYPDYYEIRTNTGADKPPHVVMLPNAVPVTDRSKVYPGAEAWFVIAISGYNDQFNKGIGGYINGVGITGNEGALGRLDNKPSAQQMFANIGHSVAPVAPAYAAAPPAPSIAPPPAPAYQMTAAANGLTREDYHKSGWTDEQLVSNGLMLPPGGVPTVF